VVLELGGNAGVIINDTYRMGHMPYGGLKGSGSVCDGIRYTIVEMTGLKLPAHADT
jgi:hypothetical protein